MTEQLSFAKRDLSHGHYIGQFTVGEVMKDGSLQSTRDRNRAYVEMFDSGLLLAANPPLAKHLGYTQGDDSRGLVHQDKLFHDAFGQTVHNVSFRAIANLAYEHLRYGVPVLEGDMLTVSTEVLGVAYFKDDADKGSVQVRTTATTENGVALEYVRQVLVNAEPGKKHPKGSSIIAIEDPFVARLEDLPRVYTDIPKGDLGEYGKPFEGFKEGDVLLGTSEDQLHLCGFSWLQIATMNDAEVHHKGNFIGYGGAVKAVAEAQVSEHIPFGYHLLMRGAHDAPVIPGDILERLYGAEKHDLSDVISSKMTVTKVEPVDGRADLGLLTVNLTAEKRATAASSRAVPGFDPENEKARANLENKGILRVDKDGANYIRVLNLEQVIAVPTEAAFR